MEILAADPGLFSRYAEDSQVRRAVQAADTRKHYLHWSRFRHISARTSLPVEKVWALVKWKRAALARELPFRSRSGRPIQVVVTDPLRSALRRIDLHQDLLDAGLPGGNSPDSETYSRRAFLEEAFFSSRIEGADTTREVARELLRSGRPARSRSEQMIVNSFRALTELDEWAEEPLSPDLLCQFKCMVTVGTLDDPEDCGRIRRDDGVRVVDRVTSEVVHIPPSHQELPERLDRICAFANEPDDDESFLHPVVRAVLLHYQIAYDHPFGDGNGRTARWVFLWSLLRRPEYWWVRFLPVSRMIERVRVSYYRAFQEADSDGSDATYLVRHQVRCVEQEMHEFGRFLRRRMELREDSRRRLRLDDSLNARQLALFDYFSRHPDAVFGQREHAEYHGVTQVTAGRDLNQLVKIGLLKSEGRKPILYRPTAKFRRIAVV